MSDETVVNDGFGNEPERVGFCQDCGKPLTRETVRAVGSRTFCEPCLTTRVGAGTAYGATTPPYTAVPPAGAGPAGVPPPPFQEPFPPVGGDNPSPVLAGFLGLIPGVGAMYNGQFAKGIAHIVIFAVFSTMANHSDIFGWLVAAWVFYQAFEAYHTAKARREGLPLPDPFGLNHIGVHVGSHFRTTAQGAPVNPGQPASYTGYPGYVAPQAVVVPPPEPGAPEAQAWGSVPATPYTQPASGWSAPPPPAGQQDWTNAPGAFVTPPPVRPSNIPGAAVWLIGLGVIFMLINFLPEWRLSLGKIFPFLLMAFAGWLFVRRMSASGGVGPVEGEGEAYVPRTVCSLRAPVILFTLGVLLAMQAYLDGFRFYRTWPILVIVFGVLLLLERSVGSRVLPVVPPDANGTGKGI